MNLEAQMNTLRGAAGITKMSHAALFRISGDDAFALVDALSTRPLFLRENQTSHTLFLHQDGGILADVFLSSGEDGYYLYAEGPSQERLGAHLQQVASSRNLSQLTLEDLSLSYELWSVNGPYSWEVVSAALGPMILGMPYLTMLHANEIICFRAGKTGEFGYDLLVPKEQVESFYETLVSLGASLGLQEISLAALDLGALENWHFCIRTLRETGVVHPLTPIEMQLQWRLSYDRDVVGMDALRAHRESAKYRAASFCATQEVKPGQSIFLGENQVGEILAAAWSFTRAEFVGIALLSSSLSHPKIHLRARTEQGEAELVTQTPPLLNNLSLHIDPHRHSFKTRHTETFPPLVSQ
jgi:glycine cleavage system aminomethyltransferase T